MKCVQILQVFVLSIDPHSAFPANALEQCPAHVHDGMQEAVVIRGPEPLVRRLTCQREVAIAVVPETGDPCVELGNKRKANPLTGSPALESFGYEDVLQQVQL